MAIFDDKTLKPKRTAFWIFSPIVALVILAILWLNFSSETGFSWGLFLLVFAVVILFLLIWKLITYLNSNNNEVKEYEKKMKKLGRR